MGEWLIKKMTSRLIWCLHMFCFQYCWTTNQKMVSGLDFSYRTTRCVFSAVYVKFGILRTFKKVLRDWSNLAAEDWNRLIDYLFTVTLFLLCLNCQLFAVASSGGQTVSTSSISFQAVVSVVLLCVGGKPLCWWNSFCFWELSHDLSLLLLFMLLFLRLSLLQIL